MLTPAAVAPATGDALGIIIGVVLVILLALGSPLALSGKRALPRWLSALTSGHTEFLFLGMLLGPGALGWFNASLLEQMQPFLTVALGWVGLIFGLQWDWLKVKRFHRAHFMVSAAQALTTFAVVTLAMLGALWLDSVLGGRIVGEIGWGERVLLASLLGTFSCVTAPIGIGWLVARMGARGKNTQLAQFISATDGIVGVILFGLVLSAVQPVEAAGSPVVGFALGVALTLGLGLLLGWLAHFIFGQRWSGPDYLLWLLGLVVFSSGAAHVMGQSPLVINFIMGATFVNLSHQSERVNRSLAGAEVPFYVIFLLLGGATWIIHLGWELVLIVPFVLTRFIGKVYGLRLWMRVLPFGEKHERDIGLTLLSQGGLALAMVIDIGLLAPHLTGIDALRAMAILSIIINQLMGPRLAEIPLRRAGELRPGTGRPMERPTPADQPSAP